MFNKKKILREIKLWRKKYRMEKQLYRSYKAQGIDDGSEEYELQKTANYLMFLN